MKAVILAAGRGERLRPLTDKIPKPMLKVRGKPILEWAIDLLKQYGVREFFMNLHHLPVAIQSYFGKGARWGVDIHYIVEESLHGTAGAVKLFEPWLRNETFLVYYGDNFTDFNLEKLIDFHRAKKGIGAVAFTEWENVSCSGIAELDATGRIKRFVEKPAAGGAFSHLVNAGVYILEPEIFTFIPPSQTVDFGKDIFPALIRKNISLYGRVMEGTLHCFDTLEMYKKSEEIFSL